MNKAQQRGGSLWLTQTVASGTAAGIVGMKSST
jgi:hypothetical protein